MFHENNLILIFERNECPLVPSFTAQSILRLKFFFVDNIKMTNKEKIRSTQIE